MTGKIQEVKMKEISRTAKTKTKKIGTEKKRRELYYHGMMFPGMIFLIIFSYIPMIGIIMAFEDFVPAKGLFHSKFVGLKYFTYLFTLPDIGKIIRNTVVIALGKIILGTLMAIIFAVLLNEIRIRFLKKFIQTIVYLPHFLSWVVLAAVVVNMFNLDGMVNQTFSSLRLPKVNFLGNSHVFPGLIIGTDVWKEFGYNSVIYLAALTAIDPGLHEAAAIDGAGWWKRVWHVTLPGMLPIILLMAAMSLTGVLSAGFDQIYNLYSPIVYDTGDVLDTYIYRIGLIGRQYSFGSAVGLFRSVIGMILLLNANQLTKKLTGQKIF